MAAKIRMASEVGSFIAALHPGDVLLFDTLHPLSELIKFAENRPANHAGIYLGHNEFAHVGRHVRGARRGGPPVKPAARTERLDAWLAPPPGPYDRTVTALRHPRLAARATDADRVIQRTLAYTNPRDTTYDYVSLLALMVPSLLRTYKGYLKDKRTLRLVLGTMRAASRAIVDVIGKEGPSRDGRSLTCSEFVYRCFDEAGPAYRIEVLEPLGSWPDPATLRSPASATTKDGRRRRPRTAGGGAGTAGVDVPPVPTTVAAGGATVVRGADLVLFGDSFRADILGPMPVGDEAAAVAPPLAPKTVARATAVPGGAAGPAGGREARAAGTSRDLALVAAQVVLDMLWTNRWLGKYDDAVDGASRGDVLPDLVTPRDLWSSPSLSAVAVLHRPPDPAVDTGLDGVPRPTDLLGG
ncbi:MAG TPA: hypothetical protein VEI83_13115 [Acidimicrobiales bacterium]|nr:hypothetical protein [Acidimicrobiales bacterium]